MTRRRLYRSERRVGRCELSWPRRQDGIQSGRFCRVALQVRIAQALMIVDVCHDKTVRELDDQLDGFLGAARRAYRVLQDIGVVGDAVDGENLRAFGEL